MNASAGHAIVLRAVSRDEAVALGDRLRAIFRDAVTVAGPRFYTPRQVDARASFADAAERWTPWLEEGATWFAESPIAGVVGYVLVHPRDHVQLLYVDPAFHGRGIGRALLAAVEPAARAADVAAPTAEASLFSHPVFVAEGYEVLAWEQKVHKGIAFTGAKMRKDLA